MQTGLVAIGLAMVALGAPASSADAKGRQAQQGLKNETGISLAVPIGRISVDPRAADGAQIYVRRTAVRDGMTVVEVSTTPFAPELASNDKPSGRQGTLGRPDQPASW